MARPPWMRGRSLHVKSRNRARGRPGGVVALDEKDGRRERGSAPAKDRQLNDEGVSYGPGQRSRSLYTVL